MDNNKDNKIIKSPHYSLEKLSEDSSLAKRGLRDIGIWPKMIKPTTKSLSKSILNSIEPEEIIYAEVTPPGAMGNSGGIVIYIPQNETDQLICYETNIYDDEEIYLMAKEVLFKHLDRQNTDNENENLYFDFYYGGMGNNVFINKKVKLGIKEDYFIYNTERLQFQIYASVQGVFNSVVNQIQKKKISLMN